MIINYFSFFCAPQVRFQCPEINCSYATTRMSLLRTHGSRVHSLQEEDVSRFEREATHLVCRGRRQTSESRVLSQMGEFAASESHRTVVKKVLEGHGITILKSQNQEFERMPTPQKGSRKEVIRILEKNNFTTNVHIDNVCSAAKSYVEMQRGRGLVSNQTISANAKYIHRYVTFGKTHLSTLDETKVLTNIPTISVFFEKARDMFAPNSLRNHAAALVDCINLGLSHPSFTLFKDISRNTLKSALKCCLSFKNDSEKKARQDQRRAINNPEEINVSILEILKICQVLKNDLKQSLDRLDKNITQTLREIPQTLKSDWHIASCVIGIFLLLQAVRLSTAINLTVCEVLSATSFQGYHVMRVSNNKTANTRGAACIALPSNQFEMVKKFADIRGRVKFCSGKLLVTARGKPNVNILEPLNKVLSKPVTFNTVRKSLETNLFLLDSKGENKLNISSYLCHTQEVARQYYRFKTDAVVVNESMEVTKLLFQMASLEVVIEKKLLPHIWNGKIFNHIIQYCLIYVFLVKCYTFVFISTGHFPAKEELSSEVEKILCRFDLKSSALTNGCYQSIVNTWREKMRHKVVLHFVERYSNALIFPEKEAIQSKLDGTVWSHDKADVPQIIRDRVIHIIGLKNM